MIPTRRVLQWLTLLMAVASLTWWNLQILSIVSPKFAEPTWVNNCLPLSLSPPPPPAPPSQKHPATAASFSNTSSLLSDQRYGWYGNQWISPRGIPVYHRQDMLETLASTGGGGILWIGDSTIRRAYGTMFALLNSTTTNGDNNNHHGDNNMDVISVDALDHPSVIDINRHALTKDIINEDSCAYRREQNHYALKRGMVEFWNNASICRSIEIAGSESVERKEQTDTRTIAFDYVRADCYRDIWRVSKFALEFQPYSWIVIGTGLHEVLSIGQCAMPIKFLYKHGSNTTVHASMSNQSSSLWDLHLSSRNYTAEELHLIEQAHRRRREKRSTNFMTAEETLQHMAWKGSQRIASTLHQYRPTQPTGVLWRTCGFPSNVGQRTLQQLHEFNRQSVEWIKEYQHIMTTTRDNNGTIGWIDWGNVIWPRSIPPNRIEGDIAAHYGLQPRLLMVQMTIQQILLLIHLWKEKKKN